MVAEPRAWRTSDDPDGLRVAVRADIDAMHRIRLAVRENRLVSGSIAPAEYAREIEVTGRGWVALEAGVVVGFSVANAESRSIWALFVDPEREGRGHGRRLLAAAVAWLFERGSAPIRLGTDPGTRAQRLYERAGWVHAGDAENGERIYELRS